MSDLHISVSSDVHEHRAPTDKSVQLLREMEIAAEQKIFNSIRVQNADIEVVIHQRKDFLNCQHEFLTIFNVNGKKHRSTYRSNLEESFDKEKMTIGIRNQLASDIATTLLGGVIDKAMAQVVI